MIISSISNRILESLIILYAISFIEIDNNNFKSLNFFWFSGGFYNDKVSENLFI